ncbi:hypothetical protein [Aquimarina intermedia]|uniref:Uncharacterized protein n=1 Tax=Aquimarina intermedia TaxID=350814 RepID=A0A5S5BRU2_9FLAO|nr:hypothetical protein [Aquimarina intermedia]TYP69911.1 hypothetical protein BD809_1168 [Aquimarina intermedia]
MKRQLICLVTILFILSSCADDENIAEKQTTNKKNVTDCELTIEPNTLVSICVDGASVALPDEVITFASTFYSKNDDPATSQFLWTIESGSMQIMNIENTFDELIAKSIATIKFSSNYSGNGIIVVKAENETGSGSDKHLIDLESN